MSRSHTIILLCGIAMASSMQGQSVSPEVQQLYESARADQAANAMDKAVAEYQRILVLAPDLAPAYNNLGRLFYNLGRYPEAIVTLKKGLHISPGMHPAEIMLGASYFQTGQLTEAVAPLEKGVRAMPDDRFARMTLARTLIGLNKSAEAVQQLDALLQVDPKDQEAWYLLGKLHLQLSEESFSKVQAIDSNSPLALELSGEIMESMQNTPGAVDAYKRAIAAAPNDPSALEHLANLYWSTGDWAHAREYFETLLAAQPGNCTARWKLANSLDELGEPPASGMNEIERALSECPNLPQAHAERARLFLRTGQPAKALPDLETAEKAAPDEPSVQQLFAQAYRALGDRPRSEAANKRFQELDAAEHAAKERHAARVLANQ